MSPTSPLTLLIAAHESSHREVLAEMIQMLRPDVLIEQFDVEGREEEAVGVVDVAMVVETTPDKIGELSAQVRARHGDAALVIIAPRFDERAISVAAQVEASAIVASPCEPVALARAIEAQERTVRFSGRCAGVETGQLLRLHAAASSDGILHLASDGRQGAIHFEDGQPVHAYCGESVGADAVRELLAWTGAKVSWMTGRSGSARTILGRIEGLLERDLGGEPVQLEVDEAPRVVLDKLERLSQTQDILGAYLLRNTEIITGHTDASLDAVIIGRALSRLARVFHDLEEQQGDLAGTEIQATVGEHRLVVDRLGPTRLGFQVGVVVRQATPVCKSLRRLLRQIDRSFRKSLVAAARQQGASGGAPDQSPRGASGLHRVA